LQGEVLPEAAGQWIIDDETQTIFAAIQEVGAFSLVYGESSKQYVAISPDDITEWVVNAPDTADLAVHQAFNIGLYGLTASKAIGVSNLISLNEDVCTVSALLSTTEYFILTTTAAGTCELAIAATEESVLSYNVTE